ncbi:MAG: hypothetical protein QM619_02135 [Micropruina sp.]|uniref:hypothetical protein n=1 Tax=Micropruina sp. TaxID=2737536 RepID=UPI0039E355F3
MALYALLDQCGLDALDASGRLPRELWLADHGPLKPQQLRDAFEASRQPTIAADGRSGVARLVWEAKCWTFEPHHDGWVREQKALRLRPQTQAETYLAICAQWALAHPALAMLGVGPRLPERARDTLRKLATRAETRDIADNERILLDCGERLIVLTLDSSIDKEVAPMLNAIRGDLATVRFSDGLADEAQKLLAAIGRFMSLAANATASSTSDRVVLAALEGAVSALRALTLQEDDVNA